MGAESLDESNGMIPDSQSKRAQDESTETRNVEPSRKKLRYSVFWVRETRHIPLSSRAYLFLVELSTVYTCREYDFAR